MEKPAWLIFAVLSDLTLISAIPENEHKNDFASPLDKLSSKKLKQYCHFQEKPFDNTLHWLTGLTLWEGGKRGRVRHSRICSLE